MAERVKGKAHKTNDIRLGVDQPSSSPDRSRARYETEFVVQHILDIISGRYMRINIQLPAESHLKFNAHG